MAKVSFTKLGLKPNNEVVNIQFNEQIIEVKQYLPVEEKLDLISSVLELSHDENNFANPTKVHVFTVLEVCEKYASINFTEKQKENPAKLYNLIVGNGLYNIIKNAIPTTEYEDLINSIDTTISAVYTYRNSLFGILDAISSDYSNLKLDVNEIQQELKNADNLTLVKDIVTKLG